MRLLSFILLFTLSGHIIAQTNYVFSGTEFNNYGTVDFAIPGGTNWQTDRMASPGYFSATGTAVFTNASDAIHVNGYVRHYGTAANQSFSFPVGSGTDLRVLSISGTIPATADVAVSWIVGNPSYTSDPTNTGASGGLHSIFSKTAPIVSVSPAGQWDWQDLAGNAAGSTITVSIPDMTSFATTATLRLVGWNGTSWVDLSGAATASGNSENNTLSGTMIAGISAIAIGSTNFVLPLNLISFSAQAGSNQCSVLLKWTTENEFNSDYFIIEQSTDGYTFESAGVVPAKGGNYTQEYQFVISQKQANTWYRLRMTDKDGSFTFSPVVKYKSSCINGNTVKVYPNPVSGTNHTITLELNVAAAGQADMYIYNSAGQVLYTTKLQLRHGFNSKQIELPMISNGIYYIILKDAYSEPLMPVTKLTKQ